MWDKDDGYQRLSLDNYHEFVFKENVENANNLKCMRRVHKIGKDYTKPTVLRFSNVEKKDKNKINHAI